MVRPALNLFRSSLMNLRATGIPALTAFLLLAGAVRADSYSKWTKDEKAKTYQCEYRYQTAEKKPATQTVVIYYADAKRANWAYFYNAKNEPWARCAIKGNPQYNAK